MNIEMLNKMIENPEVNAQALEARRLAIAINAVMEFTAAIGYTGPIRDNDARVAMAIKNAALHLEGLMIANAEPEHRPLAPVGAPTPIEIQKISEILERGIEKEITKPVNKNTP